jgi:hypothetical protein
MAMDLLHFIMVTYDAYVEGFSWVTLLVAPLIVLVGLIVHSCEPGIFAKDKDEKGESN